MSPKKKPSTSTVLAVSTASLAVLLDLPPGAAVSGVEAEGDTLLLSITGTDCTDERTDAEYSVDAHGHRTFTRFKPLGDSTGITPEDLDPPEEKE